MIRQLKEGLSKRFVFIGLIGLAMIIPLGVVHDLVVERHRYYDGVINEIAALWGNQQILQGPVLVVPFIEEHRTQETVKNNAGETETKSKLAYVRRNAIFLPDSLQITASLEEEHKKRGIYDALVYGAAIDVNAEFGQPDIDALSNFIHRIEWEKSYVVVGLSDTKAISDIHRMEWQGAAMKLAAGSNIDRLVPRGFRGFAPAIDAHGSTYELKLSMAVNGSQGLRFAPLGETTTAEFSSRWQHPKFAGDVLPDSHNIGADGFDASWRIPHLARNYPQSWVYEAREVALHELLAGVDLFEPVFLYSKITRSAKYGLLFVGLIYLTLAIFELSNGAALHYVQYGLVGISLCLFFLLLLSLSEHIGFMSAYLVAAFICSTTISVYAGRSLRSKPKGIFLFALLSAVFALLYTLLSLEDFALLVGTGFVFAATWILMYLTRSIGDKGQAT